MKNDRRRRFAAFLDGPAFDGDRQKFIKATGYSKGRVTQFLDSTEPFGEVAARGIARRLGLEEDYFERDREIDAGYFSRLMDAAMRLDDSKRDELLEFGKKLAERDGVGTSVAQIGASPREEDTGFRGQSRVKWDKANHPARRASDKARRGG